MPRLLLVGSSHRHVRIERLRALAERRDAVLARLSCLRQEQVIRGGVVLATCNRFEVLVEPAGAEPSDPGAFLLGDDPGVPLYTLSDHEAVEHLVALVLGLDSLVPGEAQIVGQLRAAFRGADDCGLLGRALHVLRNRLLEASRDLRPALGLDGRVPSIASLAAERLLGAGPRLAIVGAGETGRLALEALRRRRVGGVLVVNRTYARARALAEHFGGRPLALGTLLTEPPPLDGVLCAIHGSGTLLRRGMLPGLRLAVDVSQPSVVAPDIVADGVERVDLDALAVDARSKATLPEEQMALGRRLVRARADRIWQDLVHGGSRLSGIVDLHVESALAELDRVFRTSLCHLGDDDRETLRQTLVRVARRTAHHHLSDLRRLAPDAAGATA